MPHRDQGAKTHPALENILNLLALSLSLIV